jgi:hypothetical protein
MPGKFAAVLLKNRLSHRRNQHFLQANPNCTVSTVLYLGFARNTNRVSDCGEAVHDSSCLWTKEEIRAGWILPVSRRPPRPRES